MYKAINPLDGEIDLLGDTKTDIEWKFNPLTGRFEQVYSASSYIQTMNPYTGDFDMVGGTPAIIKEITGTGSINLTNAVRNGLLELKAYGGTEQRNLPNGYTQLEYITLDGDSYFDTGLVVNSFDVTVKSKHSITTENVTPSLMWGYMGNSSNLPRWGVGRYQSYFLWSANATSGSGSGSFDTNVHEFTGRIYTNSEEQIMREMSMDGGSPSPSTLSNQEVWSSNELSIYIGARNNNGEAGNFITGDFYNLNVIQNGVCIGNIVPAIDSDMTVGLYNTITNTFLTNLGTGTVTAGPTAVPTPEAPMNIVCNNGVLKFSKNIANVNAQTTLLGYYISSSGVVTADPNNRIYKDYIPVKPSTTYTLSLSSSVYYVTISEYSTAENSGFVVRNAGNTGSNTQLTITTGATTNYVRFGTNIDRTEITLDEVLAINWQLEIGATPTQYHEYVEGGIYIDGTTETITDELGNTATCQPLLKVGDYEDIQEILSGNITRKIGVKVLDGTETWSKTATRPNTYVSSQVITDRDISNRTTFCSHFISTDVNDNLENPGYFVVGASTQTISFSLPTSITSGTAFGEWLTEQYMKGIPVIILYVLDAPTTETTAGQDIDIQAGSNTISITQASINNLKLYAKYKGTA